MYKSRDCVQGGLRLEGINGINASRVAPTVTETIILIE